MSHSKNGTAAAGHLGTGFDTSDVEVAPVRRASFEPGAVHMPCFECSMGSWWSKLFAKGTRFTCACGARLIVESAPEDVIVHVVDDCDGEPGIAEAHAPVEVEDRAPAVRPTAPGVDDLIERGNRAREWREEAKVRLHTLMQRLVRTGGSEADAAAVLEGEAERWRVKHERRKTRERSAAASGVKP